MSRNVNNHITMNPPIRTRRQMAYLHCGRSRGKLGSKECSREEKRGKQFIQPAFLRQDVFLFPVKHFVNVCLWLHCLRIQPQDLRAFNNQWVVCHDFYSIFVYLSEAIKNVTRLTFTQEIKKIVCMWSLLLVRDRSWNSIGSTIAFILERCKFP